MRPRGDCGLRKAPPAPREPNHMALKTFRLGSRDHLSVADGKLSIDGVSCESLAGEYGTPLYVLSENRIRQNFRGFHKELSRRYSHVLVCPAYKANSHRAVTRIYKSEGAGAEVVSGFELRLALESAIEPGNIVFNGPVKTSEELQLAVSSGVGMISADSLGELDHLEKAAEQVGKQANVGMRINLGIRPKTHPHLKTALREQKFGIWMRDVLDAYKCAAKKAALRIVGIHCHIGSNVVQPQIFRTTAKAMLELVRRINMTLNLKIKIVDVGGGLGFSYQPNSRAMTFAAYASAILDANLPTLRQLANPTLVFEPGRAIIADAGLLLTRVGVAKRQGSVNWALVDAGMNTFIRPALYQARHQVAAANKMSERAVRKYSVGGPCCESGDVLAKDVPLPKIAEEDLLAVLDTGAYGYTMASNYNGQPRPAVVLVNDGKSELIRQRETFEDLIAGEITPPNL